MAAVMTIVQRRRRQRAKYDADTNGGDRRTATPQQESIPAREFSEQNVSDYVRQFLNEEREAAGVPHVRIGTSD